MEYKNFDYTNSCYEALLDLKCIFPTWSDFQGNFHYHWKQILNSTIKFKDIDNDILKNYLSILDPLINSKSGGIENNIALELIRKLDNYRKKYDEEFEIYILEEILNRDVPSIKLPQKLPKTTFIKKKPQITQKIILNEEISGSHGYGTRRSKMLSQVEQGNVKGNSSSFEMGQHLKKGISSDYVWEFTDNELKDEFEY